MLQLGNTAPNFSQQSSQDKIDFYEMTLAHLVFALGTTAYILVALQFEERDLLEVEGQAYADY